MGVVDQHEDSRVIGVRTEQTQRRRSDQEPIHLAALTERERST